MSDTLMTIIGIIVAVMLMFIFPLTEITGKSDEISQTVTQAAVSDFVNKVTTQGKITLFDYNELVQKLKATGNSYDIQIEAKILDDNPTRTTTTNYSYLIGENKYYSVYTNIILNEIEHGSGEYVLKKDDYIFVSVKNTNITIGTQFKNLLYNFVGKDTYTIGTSASGLVINEGEKSLKLGDISIPSIPPEPEIPVPPPIIEPDKTYCPGGTTCYTSWCVEYEEDSWYCNHDWVECSCGSGWIPCEGTGELTWYDTEHEYSWDYPGNHGTATYTITHYTRTCEICGHSTSWSVSSRDPSGSEEPDFSHGHACQICDGQGGWYGCACGKEEDCTCDASSPCPDCETDEESDDTPSYLPCEHGITGGHYTCSHYDNTNVTYHIIPCEHGYTSGHYY